MEAQALIATQDQTFSLETFPVPDISASQILVRNRFSGVSVGTEFAVIQSKLDWGPFPLRYWIHASVAYRKHATV